MKKKLPKDFGISVFINCPLDDEYRSLLRPMLFTMVYSGLVPRLASEKSDSLEQRIEKIVRLIKECKYSIHDLTPIVIRAAKAQGYSKHDLKKMPVPQYIGFIQQWIDSNRGC